MSLRTLRMIFCRWRQTVRSMGYRSCVSPQRLAEIEKEFSEKMAQGWFAADIRISEPY
jgi:hypothetical protein